ncbi:hypothetical protein OF83DRAFT_1261000, partial [Amylostereum chailletii]
MHALARRRLLPPPALLRARPYSLPITSSSAPPPPQKPPSPQRPQISWLARKLQQSPTAKRLFLNFFGALGFSSPKQVAGRRGGKMYAVLCAKRAEEEREFWKNECHLPPTFQSWFTITNLHIWILTTRLRALPHTYGPHYVQALIDHFFLDVEDRIRVVLQPARPARTPSPTTPPSSPTFTPPTSIFAPSPLSTESYYTVSRTPSKGKAPQALVTKQMKIFREQWNGLTLALDLALAHGSDSEMAAAVWRNLLGARGAHGIAYELGPRGDGAENDDGSGIRDFKPEEAELYLRYPETMEALVAYTRREVARLGKLGDEVV